MATAPVHSVASEAATHFVARLRVRDRTVDVPLPANLPFKEKFAVRAATGLPIEAHFATESSFGEDTLVVLWWLGRRAGGEPQLSFDQAADEWPRDLTESELEFEMVDLRLEGAQVDRPET